jgi:hypothetical protein
MRPGSFESGRFVSVQVNCADGSLYVTGDELEFILENAANALAKAIQRVESLGYKRCPMAAMSRPE